MTHEEKQLLLIDLCARLPYNIIVECSIESGESMDTILQPSQITEFIEGLITIKPYLRSMSTMTEEEQKEYENTRDDWYDDLKTYDWLIANNFDYRNLIPMGLALEAPEGMYKTK